ncbi:unnamed protein product [Linum trigynum]|uniref:Uncharacterized protein n=1 Tax=Linum trigynum TaxID=586398 RepID=A0AAV2DPD5_9ROSI
MKTNKNKKLTRRERFAPGNTVRSTCSRLHYSGGGGGEELQKDGETGGAESRTNAEATACNNKIASPIPDSHIWRTRIRKRRNRDPDPDFTFVVAIGLKVAAGAEIFAELFVERHRGACNHPEGGGLIAVARSCGGGG